MWFALTFSCTPARVRRITSAIGNSDRLNAGSATWRQPRSVKMFLKIEAIHFYRDKPFVFTSGMVSPVYIVLPQINSYPRLRSALIDFAAATIVRDIGYEAIDTIAGGETAGIPFA